MSDFAVVESVGGTRWSWFCNHCRKLGRSTESKQAVHDRFAAHSKTCAALLADRERIIAQYRRANPPCDCYPNGNPGNCPAPGCRPQEAK